MLERKPAQDNSLQFRAVAGQLLNWKKSDLSPCRASSGGLVHMTKAQEMPKSVSSDWI